MANDEVPTERDVKDLRKAASAALLRRIESEAPTTSATQLLKLAEAYAWVEFPNQPHGGSALSSS